MFNLPEENQADKKEKIEVSEIIFSKNDTQRVEQIMLKAKALFEYSLGIQKDSDNDFNNHALAVYALLAACDGIYGNSEKDFFHNVFEMLELDDDYELRLESFILEICRWEQKIEALKKLILITSKKKQKYSEF